MLSGHGQGQAAARNEAPLDTHPARMASGDEVVEYAIDDRFVKRMHVAIGGQVELERLGLNAAVVGHVFDDDLGKVGLVGDRAKRCKVRTINANGVIPPRGGVGKGFER